MEQMTWNECYSVGIVSIDEQHKNLMETINKLRRCVRFKQGREDVDAVLESLILSTVEHFDYEESLFDLTNYPAAQEHKEEHEKLKTIALGLYERFKANVTGTISLDVLSFLDDWLLSHINLMDKRFTTHLLAHNVV